MRRKSINHGWVCAPAAAPAAAGCDCIAFESRWLPQLVTCAFVKTVLNSFVQTVPVIWFMALVPMQGLG
jgi:hypothetical protein